MSAKLSLVLVVAGSMAGGLSAQEGETRVIGGGGGASVGVGVKPASEKVVGYETTVKLAPARQWTSVEGKGIVGELLSWPIKGAKVSAEEVKGLKIEVVRDKKVRLRTGGKVAVVALERFSEADREFVRELVEFHEKWRKKEAAVGTTGAETE